MGTNTKKSGNHHDLRGLTNQERERGMLVGSSTEVSTQYAVAAMKVNSMPEIIIKRTENSQYYKTLSKVDGKATHGVLRPVLDTNSQKVYRGTGEGAGEGDPIDYWAGVQYAISRGLWGG